MTHTRLSWFAWLLALYGATQATAAIITVNTATDPIDIDWTTATVADLPGPDGVVSFSEAMIAANNTAGADTIGFAIPQAEWPMQWYLPGRAVVQSSYTYFWRANDAVTIDGTTQTAFTGDTNPDGAEVAFFGGQLYFNVDNCTVRGLDGVPLDFIGSNNLIAENTRVGITLYGGSGSLVRNNTGGSLKIDRSNDNVAVGNTFDRVRVLGWFDGGQPATNNRIGGPKPQDRNFIIGLGTWNSEGYPGGFAVQLFDATGTIIENNQIGTTVDGMSQGHQATTSGILFEGRNDATTVRGNRIAGILGHGIGPHYAGWLVGCGMYVSGSGTSLEIVGNTIGLDAAGEPTLGSVTGIEVGTFNFAGFSGIDIGGSGPGQGNEIAGHRLNGVTVGTVVPQVRLSGNAIHDNLQLGIDLVSSAYQYGVSPNDPLDADGGGNGGQNFPAIATAGAGGGMLRVTGSLDSSPDGTFRIEFFASPACDPSGYGQGQVFVGATDVQTNGAGTAGFDAVFNTAVEAGWILSATATLEPLGATSEFSPCAVIVTDLSPVADALPPALALAAAHPNPFNPRTTVGFTVPRPGPVTVTVHDLAGRRVTTLLDEVLTAGTYEVTWTGQDEVGRPVPSGLYFARLVAGGESRTGKLVLLK